MNEPDPRSSPNTGDQEQIELTHLDLTETEGNPTSRAELQISFGRAYYLHGLKTHFVFTLIILVGGILVPALLAVAIITAIRADAPALAIFLPVFAAAIGGALGLSIALIKRRQTGHLLEEISERFDSGKDAPK